MNKATLVVMAAGIGSRFGGGIKQLEPVGPRGEIIMDYSIYDAIQAGFDKVVFVIRKDLEEDFRRIIGDRIEKKIKVEYAFQEVDDIPAEYKEKFAGRTKPWGTGQAVLCCKDVVKEPFVIINADDYYGKEAFVKVHDYLVEEHPASDKLDFCMAGFLLENTLSENGGVTRGICSVNEQGHLTKVTETKNIVKTAEGAAVQAEDGSLTAVQAHCPVSMNMWGFTGGFMKELVKRFPVFLEKSIPENPLKCEYFLPFVVDELLQEKKAAVRVLTTQDKWYGVPYKEDKPVVVAAIQNLKDQGLYPQGLWD